MLKMMAFIAVGKNLLCTDGAGTNMNRPDNEAYARNLFNWLADPSKEATYWGPMADLDGDGLNTLLEFAANTDPRDGTSAARPSMAAGIDSSDERPYIDFTFRR